tara:strand:- start:488 stop:1066 length:579 start_codon:yes stop_codon:yes gene_type:complete
VSDQLDIFGFDVSQLDEVKIDNPTTLSEVFNNIAADMVFCLQQSVKKENLTFKGGLLDSIKMPVKMFGFRMIATLFMADYYDYVNKGVKGIGGKRKSGKLKGQGWEIKAPNSPYSFKKGPKVSHIRQWAKSKGLNEYAVRTSIAHKGTSPRYFFDNCMQETFYGETFNKFKTDIRVVSGERVAKGLKEILEK